MKTLLLLLIFGNSLTLQQNSKNENYDQRYNPPRDIITFESTIFQKNKIRLKWSTLSEKNTEVFIIQNSKDGNDFKDITMVVSNINSHSISKYDFIDIFPNTGKNYYRLKIIDYDGHFEYSKTICISNNI